MIELNKIYNEDCLNGMQRIPDGSVDCIICDLPYEVLNKGNKHAEWDRIIPFDKLWEQYERIIKDTGAIVLFAQGMFTAKLMMSNERLWRYNLVWQKGGRCSGFLNAKKMPLREHEDILVFYKALPTYNPQFIKGEPNHARGKMLGRRTNRCYGEFGKSEEVITDQKYPKSILNFQKPHPSIHPTQKPVALIEYFIRTYTNEGETILDNCMGSGTTAIAAIRAKRNFIGFELQKEYFDMAEKRIKEERRQLTLF